MALENKLISLSLTLEELDHFRSLEKEVLRLNSLLNSRTIWMSIKESYLNYDIYKVPIYDVADDKFKNGEVFKKLSDILESNNQSVKEIKEKIADANDKILTIYRELKKLPEKIRKKYNLNLDIDTL